MKTAIKDKHLRPNQEKIERVKKIIGAKGCIIKLSKYKIL